jgi:hypothetical protein
LCVWRWFWFVFAVGMTATTGVATFFTGCCGNLVKQGFFFTWKNVTIYAMGGLNLLLVLNIRKHSNTPLAHSWSSIRQWQNLHVFREYLWKFI